MTFHEKLLSEKDARIARLQEVVEAAETWEAAYRRNITHDDIETERVLFATELGSIATLKKVKGEDNENQS